MQYTHAQIADLVQHTVAAVANQGCSIDDAEQIILDWQRTA